MKTATKEYSAKSSAARAAKKAHGDDAFSKGQVKTTQGGKFYFEPAPVDAPKLGKALNKKSLIDSPCAMVWEIAGQMEGARRKDIIEACEKAGIAFYTARTQYQRYREALRESLANAAAANAA